MNDLAITVGGVKYVTVALAARETGVKENTVRMWMAAGAVETIERRVGKATRVLVRLGAVRYLRNTPAEQTRAEGIRRVSAAARRAAKAYFARKQGITQAVATRAYEVWEATEEGRAIDLPDGTVTDEALVLGRSYAAVIARRAKVAKEDRGL